ncbi:hypothetical protein [Solidesulfovibrio alcoholivorans]|uniref:hypothetical protein n=1 Tax=Solidesulfovibrio alcoholivorans TaxID=81406 RepID=UPI0012EBB852|nr:hypothetical protein [Solidesulfovibrio alcoholivorans]
MPKEPTTMREAMVAEVLGDIGNLLTRVESVNKALPDATEKAISKIRAALELASGDLTSSGERLTREFDVYLKESLGSIRQVSKDIQQAAKLVDKSSHRIAIYSAIIGFSTGIFGGILSALAFSNFFFR